jgi:hypothetical protein
MRKISFGAMAAAVLALAVLALPLGAEVIPAGIDVWHTPNDGATYVDLTDNPIPADFFCLGSAPLAQQIGLKGTPVPTVPAGVLNSTDTVVQRLSAVDVEPGESATTSIVVRAICFAGRQRLNTACGNGTTKSWLVSVRLDPAVQPPATTMTIFKGSGLGGTFDATVKVPGIVEFTNVNDASDVRSVTETITMSARGAAWANAPGTGGVSYSSQVSVDAACGVASPAYVNLPGTSPNFAAGWSNGCNPPCPIKVSHQGPHPVFPLPPPPPCSTTTTQAQKLSTRTFSATQVVTVDPSIQVTPCIGTPTNVEVIQIFGADAAKVVAAEESDASLD